MNLPDGFPIGFLNDNHFPECEEQDEDKPCICSQIEDALTEGSSDIYEGKARSIFDYNEEVKNVIMEGIKI